MKMLAPFDISNLKTRSRSRPCTRLVRSGFVRIALRLSLAAAVLSAVADRFGWWEPFGQGSWGSMDAFAEYAHQLVPFASGWLLTVIVWAAIRHGSDSGSLARDRLAAKARWRSDFFGAHSVWNRDGCIPRYGITA